MLLESTLGFLGALSETNPRRARHLPDTENGHDRVIMKIAGVLVDLLVSLDPAKYGPFVVSENGVKTLYVELLRAIYRMLMAALICYRQFKSDLEATGLQYFSQRCTPRQQKCHPTGAKWQTIIKQT
jgi:hypothetical protein